MVWCRTIDLAGHQQAARLTKRFAATSAPAPSIRQATEGATLRSRLRDRRGCFSKTTLPEWANPSKVLEAGCAWHGIKQAYSVC